MLNKNSNSAIQKITSKVVTDEKLKQSALAYAARYYSGVTYKPEIQWKDNRIPAVPNSDDLEEVYVPVEDKKAKRIQSQYVDFADRRLPVYDFLENFKRLRSGVIPFYTGEQEMRKKAEFEFTNNGLINKRRYTCQIISRFDKAQLSDCFEGCPHKYKYNRGILEVVISDGQNTKRQEYELKSVYDDPTAILEFASFLYDGQENKNEQERIKQDIGNMFLRNTRTSEFPKQTRRLARITNLFYRAMHEGKMTGLDFYTRESDKLREIAKRLSREEEFRRKLGLKLSQPTPTIDTEISQTTESIKQSLETGEKAE